MNLLWVVAPAAIVLTIAYLTYGRLLSKLLRLDPKAKTPAVELRDDVDYSPIEPKFLLGQHFSAIAAAGPVVGPIVAGLMFGWLPALLWILIGSIFIGGVHDMTSLTASIRHKARSIAEVVRDHMSQRSYLLFLSFIWIALVYIIVAFTDITAEAFIGGPEHLRLGKPAALAVDVPAAETAAKISEAGGVTGGAIATSSILYLVLPIVMGLLLRYTKLSLGWATVIFVPLVGVVIWLGQYMPLDVGVIVQRFRPELSLGEADLIARKIWGATLLAYCLVAGAIPVWLLLQPRGHLGGYFLYAALAAGVIGVIFGGHTIQYDAVRSWTGPKGETLVPYLFILIACGACSGFHSLIASGTTSKQLKSEVDAKPIGYGSMLLEAMVATLALACVMMLASDSPLITGKASPNIVYANGIGQFLTVLRIPLGFAVAFGLMAFTTFVYDTLDVCTRLGRFIIQELLGMPGTAGRWLGTSLTAGVPLFFVLQTTIGPNGKPIPVWQTFWPLFGASNQLLAALTLLGVTVWLWRTRRAAWVWFVTGLPTVLMYVMSTWALLDMTWKKFHVDGVLTITADPVPWAGVVLVVLAALMLVEAFIAIFGHGGPPTRLEKPLASGAA